MEMGSRGLQDGLICLARKLQKLLELLLRTFKRPLRKLRKLLELLLWTFKRPPRKLRKLLELLLWAFKGTFQKLPKLLELLLWAFKGAFRNCGNCQQIRQFPNRAPGAVSLAQNCILMGVLEESSFCSFAVSATSSFL